MTKSTEKSIVRRAIAILVDGKHGPSKPIGGKALYDAINRGTGLINVTIPEYKRISNKVLSGYFESTRPKRNPRRLKSARSVARRLKLRGLKSFKGIARRTRKNCGCKRGRK